MFLFVMALQFIQVPTHIQEIAKEVYSSYPSLQDKEVVIRQKELKKSTMRAFPKLSWNEVFPKIKYCLHISPFVRDTDEQKVAELDSEILRGWLAHEFGHLHDYVNRSFFEMVGFGLQYIFSNGFATEVEHRADRIAVKHGYYESLKMTKNYLFRKDASQTKYGMKLSRLYMSLEDLEICNQDWIEKCKQERLKVN